MPRNRVSFARAAMAGDQTQGGIIEALRARQAVRADAQSPQIQKSSAPKAGVGEFVICAGEDCVVVEVLSSEAVYIGGQAISAAEI